jgi:hypothetical protein
VADEFSPGELARSIADLRIVIATLVSLREHELAQQHMSRRQDQLEHDQDTGRAEWQAAIAVERTERRDADETLRTEQVAKSSGNRSAFLAFIGGLAAMVIFAAIQGWIGSKGGH